MTIESLTQLGMTNIHLPALYIPIGPVEKSANFSEAAGRDLLAEMKQRTMPFRVIRGGFAVLVEDRQNEPLKLHEFRDWLRENS